MVMKQLKNLCWIKNLLLKDDFSWKQSFKLTLSAAENLLSKLIVFKLKVMQRNFDK